MDDSSFHKQLLSTIFVRTIAEKHRHPQKVHNICHFEYPSPAKPLQGLPAGGLACIWRCHQTNLGGCHAQQHAVECYKISELTIPLCARA